MEKWSAIEEENKHLATIRVYDSDPRTGRTRIMLLIPPSETDDPEALKHPDEYELDMVNESVENQIVIAEREKAPKSRARTTILTGTVKHECNLRPLFTDNYRKRMKERHRLANTPKRQIRMVNEVEPGRGRLNQLTSGMGRTNAFSNLVVSY
jgi:transcription initiation factor TFIIF subunit beta